MKEIKEIVAAYDLAIAAGKKTALATVVHVEGSSYRRPGARMLVTDDGQLTGAISGGCLEGDALRKARLVINQHKSLLVTYDTMDDDDAKLGVGLGCNGMIHILIEPIAPDHPDNPIGKLKEFLSKRQEAVLVTLFCLADRHASQPGTCLLMNANGQVKGNYYAPELKTFILEEAGNVLKEKSSHVKNFSVSGQVLTIFTEFLQPAISLVIIGAGNDIIPLAEMAGILGWETTIADGRPNLATTARFPTATRILVAKANEVLPQIAIDSQTAFVLMTHNYNYDWVILKGLVQLDVPYIGVLGPKKKLDRMLEELIVKNTLSVNSPVHNIYGPIGLDIGAETAEEISLSVLSEIKAVLSKKEGKFLRDKHDTIHSRHPLTTVLQQSKTEETTLQCQLHLQIKSV